MIERSSNPNFSNFNMTNDLFVLQMCFLILQIIEWCLL